ncbi:MAG TPA: Hsp70 family protein [Spirochaetota bacterium]|nr:Hsp70 family protein [Spirochaetota bacterium]
MKKAHLAIDLGTTNTVVAHWNNELDSPEILHMDAVCRNTRKKKEIDDSYTIPSTVYLLPPSEVYPFPLNYIFRRTKSRTGGLIGIPAIQRDGGAFSTSFVTNFKSHMGKNSYQILGRLRKWSYTADDITRIFLNELFREIRRSKKLKPHYVTFCVPVDFYEFYRAKLKKIAGDLGISGVRTIDEPVAAALGYGLSLDRPRNVLVIDFGAGTLDFALIRVEERTGEQGTCTVIAKEGAPLGGNIIDAWIVEELCSQYGYNFSRLSTDPDIIWWFKMLLGEACRIKEALFFKKSETFYLMPSGIMKNYAHSIPGGPGENRKPIDVSRNDLVSILKKNGLYTMMDNLITRVLEEAVQRGITEDMIDDVLMVGGSTLLPDVYSLVEKRFRRDRVRAWQPFNAVAFGAAAFAAGRFQKSDHITHDYAFVTYNKKNHEQEYSVIVPRGTTFPTKKDFWKRQLVPTCALGEPERIFKLVICEIGRSHSINQEFVWDEKGDLYSMQGNDNDKPLVVPLNESDPTLGYLNPPHYPSERGARVEISFMINEDKWLCSSVFDLKTRKYLLEDEPVIRLK